ncbi:hypothetical protein Droror1_Dr00009604 [Drosera rotundifolia]
MDEIAAYYAAAAPPPPPGTRHHHDPYSPPPPHPIPLHHQQAPLVILTPAPSNLRVRPSAHVSLHHPPPIHSPYSQVISVPRSEDEDEPFAFAVFADQWSAAIDARHALNDISHTLRNPFNMEGEMI